MAGTFAVAVAGPSVMEPALPGRPGQPPWSFGLHPSPYLAVGLTAAALAAGTLGLVLVLRAIRGGWSVPARAVLVAGLLAAAALTLVPPFGSSDHLSYAAYGRMLVTGHNPYTTTPAQLAALGDPVARAVQDWSGSPSVYGPLATAIQALASLAGGTSVRLTVFVLGLANLAAFAGTALLLHWMTRGHPAWQLRAALLWAANPLLLQVLVAGAHVDSQAVVFGVAAVAVMSGARAEPSGAARGAGRGPGRAGVRGQGHDRPGGAGPRAGRGAPGRARAAARSGGGQWPPLAGLAAGFAVTAGTAVAIGGSAMLRQSSQASDMVSIGSPWRVIRTIIHLAVTGTAATDMVKAGAVALAVLLAVLLIRGLDPRSSRRIRGGGLRAGAGLAVRLALCAAVVRRARLGAAPAGPAGAGRCRGGPLLAAAGQDGGARVRLPAGPPGRRGAAGRPWLAAAGDQARGDARGARRGHRVAGVLHGAARGRRRPAGPEAAHAVRGASVRPAGGRPKAPPSEAPARGAVS